MSIQIKDGVVLFVPSGTVAMDPDCCCEPPCECTVPHFVSDCENCASSDYPTALDTQVSFQFTISDVFAGSSGFGAGCPGFYEQRLPGPPGWTFGGVYLGSGCEDTTAATHNDFFNGTFVLAPCTSVLLRQCSVLGCRVIPGVSQEYTMVEYNELRLSVDLVSAATGVWSATIEMMSTVLGIAMGVGEPDANACMATAYGTEPRDAGFVTYSYRQRTINLMRTIGTYVGWRWDPAFCTEPCNSTIQLLKCTPSEWELTLDSETNDFQTSCGKACDFDGAAVSVSTV